MTLAQPLCMAPDMNDFEISKGFKPIPLKEVRRFIQLLPYASPDRIYTLMMTISASRPGEMQDITWYDFSGDTLCFRPKKQHGKITRLVKIPPKVFEELQEYKRRNGFKDQKLFDFTYKTFQTHFNKEYRYRLGGAWVEYDPLPYSKTVKHRHKYVLRCIRTTISTLVYLYFQKKYGDYIALSRTCAWLGHESKKMTCDHYIRNINTLGVDFLPQGMPLLEALDWLVYGEVQHRITEYERQCSLNELDLKHGIVHL